MRVEDWTCQPLHSVHSSKLAWQVTHVRYNNGAYMLPYSLRPGGPNNQCSVAGPVALTC